MYRDTDVDGPKSLSMKQVEKLEEAISKVSSGNKGRCGKVFEMKTIVEGPKKAGQEALAVKNPSNGEVVVNSKEVKKVTLKYCLDVLNNNEPDDGVAESVEITNSIFKEIIKSKDGEFEVTEDGFEEVLNNLEKKNKRTYDFLTKASKEFKRVVFKLCRRILRKEEIPEGFFKTLLILYKGSSNEGRNIEVDLQVPDRRKANDEDTISSLCSEECNCSM